MITLLVMSDSHGDEDNVRWAMEKHPDASRVIHLGDGAGEQAIIREASARNLCVAGNCDWYSDAPVKQIVEIDGIQLLLTHGHEYRVKSRLDTLAYAAEAAGVQAALFGHTHRQANIFAGNVYLINPGSIRAGEYALVKIENGKIETELRRLND